MFVQVEPVINHSVRGLCVRPYYNHPKGCPNFNKKVGCPPQAILFENEFDLNYPVYAIYNKFNLKEHMEKMKLKQPKWTEHQLRCVLYWQPKARNQLLVGIKEFIKEHKNYRISTCPEAQGINVTETMKNAGIELEWMPQVYAYQIALAGIKR